MSFTSRTNFEAPNFLSAYDFIFSLFHPYISFLLVFLINCGGARALDLEGVFFCSARTHFFSLHFDRNVTLFPREG